MLLRETQSLQEHFFSNLKIMFRTIHPALFALGASLFPVSGEIQAADRKPNIVFVLADDLGYADIGCFGAKGIKTPNIDRLADSGVRFSDFYAPAGVCTPSRASLMTGCYPKRVDMHVEVLYPDSRSGLNPSEVTLAEVLKSAGYQTGCIGKWHLGQLPAVMPTAQGFDSYYGRPGPNHGRSDVYRNTTLIKKNDPADYPNITREYTAEALSFFRQHDPAVTGKPFFLYLAHSMPHIPLAVSEKFKGSSNAGLYGDVIQELDWSIGELLKWLETSGQLKNTIFIFTSDNGPSGVAAPPLHGGKGSTWEGGFRVPMIIRWDGNIPAGRMCKETATMMDFLPTLAAELHLPLPKNVKRDGHNIWALMTQEGAGTPYKELYYYGRDGKLAAVRSGNLKVHMLEPSERWAGKQPVQEALLDRKPTDPLPWLYDLKEDVGETRNLTPDKPGPARRLLKRAGRFDETLTKEIRHAYVEP